ncbi:MAG: hypothetical protein K2X62_12890, partial [Beijerinckiaceae bacterium]|nr:hypothetical protein [Beijerinckiaceae bacterium]
SGEKRLDRHETTSTRRNIVEGRAMNGPRIGIWGFRADWPDPTAREALAAAMNVSLLDSRMGDL